MKEKSYVDPDLKNFFELQVLKQLFEDNFLAFVDGKPGNCTAVELAERVFSIAQTQNYSDFGIVYRTQLIDALEQILEAYRDISHKHSVLAERFPDIKFAILGGWRKYKIYNDGSWGKVLKIVAEVRIASGRTALELYNENVINATVYLVDRYDYEYRTVDLTEWNVQNNLIVWKDIVQGNGFLNFILTKSRSEITPMRVVLSTSTREMLKPPAPPPTPIPWPGPHPWPVPPGPVPPGPFPPGPGPIPPGPTPFPPSPIYPPMPGPGPAPMPGPTPYPGPGPAPMPDPHGGGGWPQPIPGPCPQPIPGPYPPVPGPQPHPIYPPKPIPPPAPIPFWPPPPPPPPVIAECALIREVLAERTVGGIKKGSRLPAGLTFTLFVEWLLRGESEMEYPTGVLAISQPVMEEPPVLTFRITDLGTAVPQTIHFYQVGTLDDEASGASPRGDIWLADYPYVEGQLTYVHQLAETPTATTRYYTTFDYVQPSDQSEGTEKTNEVQYDPPAEPDQFTAAAVPTGTETITEAQILENPESFLWREISNDLISAGMSVHIPTDYSTFFIAIPRKYETVIHWYESDGATVATPPTPYYMTIKGVEYAAYLSKKEYVGDLGVTYIWKNS